MHGHRGTAGRRAGRSRPGSSRRPRETEGQPAGRLAREPRKGPGAAAAMSGGENTNAHKLLSPATIMPPRARGGKRRVVQLSDSPTAELRGLA
eukprot:5615876-Alexandrium_andersonii.AAC.1